MYVVFLVISIFSLHRWDVDSWVRWVAVLSSSGFGEMMGGSPMVIMWPSRDEDGSYSSVTLSQRKAPFEVMPEPDPDPPFTATLYMEGTSVRRPARLPTHGPQLCSDL
jgi:hypothetical protein